MIGKTRRHDMDTLRKDYQSTKDPNIRRQISDAARRITHETRAMESMRQRLVTEHRKGRMDNVRDIQESIKNNPKYYQSKHE